MVNEKYKCFKQQLRCVNSPDYVNNKQFSTPVVTLLLCRKPEMILLETKQRNEIDRKFVVVINSARLGTPEEKHL